LTEVRQMKFSKVFVLCI